MIPLSHTFLSKLEQSAQVRRKVLNDYYDYDPAKIFKKLDSENKGYINSANSKLALAKVRKEVTK